MGFVKRLRSRRQPLGDAIVGGLIVPQLLALSSTPVVFRPNSDRSNPVVGPDQPLFKFARMNGLLRVSA